MDQSIARFTADNDMTGVEITDRGPWMGLAFGGRFYPLDPRPEEVAIDDIAVALGRITRYNGHYGAEVEFYSVAQHSTIMSFLAEDLPEDAGGGAHLALVALLHDATEAYVGDMVRPLKQALPGFKRLEDLVWQAIARKWGLPAALPAAVKQLDNLVLASEKRDLIPLSEPWPGFDWADPDVIINPLMPRMASWVFAQRFNELAERLGMSDRARLERPAAVGKLDEAVLERE